MRFRHFFKLIDLFLLVWLQRLAVPGRIPLWCCTYFDMELLFLADWQLVAAYDLLLHLVRCDLLLVCEDVEWLLDPRVHNEDSIAFLLDRP